MDSKATDSMPSSDPLAVSDANNHLAIHLYKQLAKEPTNMFFSPFSLSTALAMLFCGSKDETANEMRQVLGYEIAKIEDQCIKSFFQQLLSDLENGSDGYTLACANSILCDKLFSVKEEFKEILKESFKALMLEVDFRTDSKGAVQHINKWVKQKTNNMIPQLLDELNSSTVMVILNAVYFKGFWLNKFSEQNTYMQNFYNNDIEGNAKQVKMMHLKKAFPYIEKESFKAMQFPYKGKDICMLILLPNSKNGLDELGNSLTLPFLRSLQLGMRQRNVEVAFPKFRLEYSKSLKQQFQILGMNRLFRPGAEFGGINDSKELFISEIIHKAVIEVNEEGAEASAATAIVMKARCMKVVKDPTFIVEHPFLFAIYNQKLNLILFMGRVNEL